MSSASNKQRTYGRFREFSRRGNENKFESDGTFLLKLISVFLLGTFWLKFQTPLSWGAWAVAGLPLGFVLGLFLVKKFERFQSNRKIWYVVLMMTTILSYFVPAGIMV